MSSEGVLSITVSFKLVYNIWITVIDCCLTCTIVYVGVDVEEGVVCEREKERKRENLEMELRPA